MNSHWVFGEDFVEKVHPSTGPHLLASSDMLIWTLRCRLNTYHICPKRQVHHWKGKFLFCLETLFPQESHLDCLRYLCGGCVL